MIVLCPVEGLSPVKGIAGLDKSPTTPENSGGLGFLSSGTLAPGNQLVRCSSSPERDSALVLNDRVVYPVEGLSPVKGIAGSDKSPATPENSGGLGFLSSGTLAPGN